MPYTLKTSQISVKDPETGEYSGVDILAEQTEEGLIAELQAEGTTQVNRINQAAVDVQAAVDQAESDAATIISSTQSSINTLEAQKNTIAKTVASMAELGTDTTLSTPGMAADAGAVGELNQRLCEAADILAGSEAVNLGYEVAGTSHYIVASTGAVSSESLANWSYTDYVDVSMYSAIEYKRSMHTIATPAVGMAFYDDTKTYISGISGYGSRSSLGYELFVTPIPNNAKYARFSLLIDAQTYGAFIVKGKTSLVFSGCSVTPPAYKNEYYWNVEGETAISTSISGTYWRAYDPIDVLPGETYSITAAQGRSQKARCWVVVDENDTILIKDDDYFRYGDTPHTTRFTVPENGAKLLLSARLNVTPVIVIYKILNQSISYAKYQSLSEQEKNTARNNIDAAASSDVNVAQRITSFTLSSPYFWNVETNIAVYTILSGSNWMASTVVPVHEGEVYTVSGTQGSTHKTRIWAVTDDSMNILDMAEDYYGDELWHTETFIVPTGGTKLVMTTRYNVGSPYIYLNKQSKLKDTLLKILTGKTVAVLGDSISTNGNTGDDPNVPEITVTADDVGVELSAYLTYYDVQEELSLGGHTFTSSEIGNEVTFTPTVDDIGKKIGLPNNYNPNSTTVWWERMQTVLGNTTIPVCWSGSSITSHEASQATRKTAHAWHPAQIRKCGIRTPGTMTRKAPDMIIIYRGTNDFSHEPYTKLTPGYFDGASWEYPEDDTVTGGYGYLEGLALTIKKLREAYPDTQIYLCTLNVFKRINYSHFPTNNGLNTLPEYNNAIREAANFFGCGLIEFDKDGITFENCYSGGYITDSSTIPTHPSDKGHYVMGRKAIADIKAQYNEL